MMKIKYSFENWCKDNNRQNLLDLWDYELNNKTPNEINFGTEDAYWFKCPRGLHKSLYRRIDSVRKSAEIFCPECNTFGCWLIDNLGDDAVEKYWSDKNNCSPFEIPRNGELHIWAKHIDERFPDYDISIRNFMKQRGIPKYNKWKVVKGVNDIATTHPDHAKYFLNDEDKYKYSYGVKQCVDIICPICKCIRNVRIDIFTRTAFSCPACGDNGSYPNKFIHEFLRQLSQYKQILFKPEKIFAWSKNINNTTSRRSYDFYLSFPQAIIIEAHGAQHYDASFCSIPGARTLKEERENDLFKYNLAISNGILNDNYVVLNCSKSNKEWIKCSVMNSVLPIKLGFVESDIDWEKCDRMATTSQVIIAADLWNNGMRNTRLIANELHLNSFTVEKYLHKAHDLGICDYDATLLKQFGQQKPIACKENGMVFSSAQVCEEMSEEIFGEHLSCKQIQYSARKQKSTHNFNFAYITQQEFSDHKMQFPDITFGRVYLTI